MFTGADMMHKFEARLVGRGPKGAWTYLQIPFNVQEVFGKRSRVPVKGTINGFPFRSSLMPEGDGTHSLIVAQEFRKGANAGVGDLVQVALALDDSERVVDVPAELKQALQKHKRAAAKFTSLAYTHQKEFAHWISSAKKAETKTARCQKTVLMLEAGQKVK
jgi:hypothetical protein